MTTSNCRCPRRFCVLSRTSDTTPTIIPPSAQRHAEQQVQRDRAADHLREVGRRGDELRLYPEREPRAPSQPRAEHSGQRLRP